MADGFAPGAVKTTCPYCGVGCGVTATASPARSLAISGDMSHPANLGRLCSKGTALGSTVGLEGRLLQPRVQGREAAWSEAIRTVAETFSRTIAEHGPDAVAFYVSGQLLTEDYYVANKLMKGFIGSGNIDTNSRLCMASAVTAHKLAFGADLVPGCYEDLDLADLVVFSGHNAAWTHPVLFRRMEAQRERGQRHVVIDPRRTDTAEGCDLHLALAPQTDVRLWNGLLADLLRRGAVNRAFMSAHVAGLDEVLHALAADDQSPGAVAADCGLALTNLTRFYDLFAETPRTVSLFSMGANQSTQGVAKGLAILNAHLATGRIGKPGAAPFSITGQPNAMGGREVGGMANTLAAHMDFDPVSRDRVARFWRSNSVATGPGLKAVDMFEAVADGRIKAIWIMATNPVVSLPDASRIRRALSDCPFVVVSDCMADTDTLTYAHVALPALGWSEKEGTVTNSERTISRQRATLSAPGSARADWRIVADVAKAMGFGAAFDWDNPGEVFREWAEQTTFENADRILNLGPLAATTAESYAALGPVQWPVTLSGGTRRLFEDGRFQTADGRAAMVPVRPAGPAQDTNADYPLALNTGRVRDHWHTLTRTGLAPQLSRHTPEPYVEIHPADIPSPGLIEGQLVAVTTAQGSAVAIARLSDRQRPGSIFMPMHWSKAYAPSGQANPLVSSAVDARSGQPEFKHTPARIRPYAETWSGFLISRAEVSMPNGLEIVWRRIPQTGCQLYEFAGRGGADERGTVGAGLMRGAPGERVRFEDASAGALREASIDKGTLDRILFMTKGARLPPREWLVELFQADILSPSQRAALLIGRQPGVAIATGPSVCGCRAVRARPIEAAILNGARTLADVGEITGAGLTCGSCRPEISRMLALMLLPEAPDVA